MGPNPHFAALTWYFLTILGQLLISVKCPYIYGCLHPSFLTPPAKHGEWRPPLPHLVPDPQAFVTQRGALRSRPSPCYRRMNMLKSSGLKIPGRGPKHSSPVGRTSAGGTSSPVVPKDSKSLPPSDPVENKRDLFLPFITSYHRKWLGLFILC